MIIPILAVVIRALWLVIEYPYLRRHKIKPAQDWDKHSAIFWDVAHVCELIGVILGFIGLGRIQTDTNFIGLFGLTLLLAGVIIRWVAIYTLGRYFTSVVMIKEDHRIIQRGLYKYLRHPAYTGTLIGHLGIGLSFSNWFTISFSSIPYLVAALYRMQVEEKVLKDSFGEEYVRYAKRTKRLIPKVY
ncbi:MAG: isoprenylcysteine carboxylmethyltransferase family protein [Acidobacteriota bacterium]|nr:isoprenylcysteine carboxylmethyltransferase family protein [Acidobacteriota bacterium]